MVLTTHSIRVSTRTLLTLRLFTLLFEHFSGCFGLEHFGNTLQFSKLFLFSASFRLKVAILLLFWILWITTAAATCSTWLFLRENAGGYAHYKMGWSPNFWAATAAAVASPPVAAPVYWPVGQLSSWGGWARADAAHARTQKSLLASCCWPDRR